MENELRSPKAGTVKEVAVSAGTSVEAGRVLVIVAMSELMAEDATAAGPPAGAARTTPAEPRTTRRTAKRRRLGSVVRCCVLLAVLLALVAGLIVTLLIDRPRPAGPRTRGERGLEVSQAADAHRQAGRESPAPARSSVDDLVIEGLKPTDRPFLARRRSRRSAVVDRLHPRG